MGGRKSSLARAAAMPAAGAGLPPSLHLPGPAGMGYFDFFTFLMPLDGLSLRLDARRFESSWVLAFLLMVG
jgi:hypothetical protein